MNQSNDRSNFRISRRIDCLDFENFDLLNKVDTLVNLELSNDGLGEYRPGILSNSAIYKVSNGYQPSALPHIDTINNYLKNTIKEVQDYTFIDMGAGKNKVLIHNFLTKQNYKKMIGVEIDTALYNIGKSNCKAINSNIEMINLDLIDYECKEEATIYFSFNPCLASHWKKFLEKNSSLLLKNKTIFVNIVGFINDDPQPTSTANYEKKFGFLEIYNKDLIYIYISENVELLK